VQSIRAASSARQPPEKKVGGGVPVGLPLSSWIDTAPRPAEHAKDALENQEPMDAASPGSLFPHITSMHPQHAHCVTNADKDSM